MFLCGRGWQNGIEERDGIGTRRETDTKYGEGIGGRYGYKGVGTRYGRCTFWWYLVSTPCANRKNLQPSETACDMSDNSWELGGSTIVSGGKRLPSTLCGSKLLTVGTRYKVFRVLKVGTGHIWVPFSLSIGSPQIKSCRPMSRPGTLDIQNWYQDVRSCHLTWISHWMFEGWNDYNVGRVFQPHCGIP